MSTLCRKLGKTVPKVPFIRLFHSSCPQQFFWSLRGFEYQAESRSPRGNSYPQPHSYSHLFVVVHRNTHAQHPQQQPSSGLSVCAGTFLIVSPALDGSTNSIDGGGGVLFILFFPPCRGKPEYLSSSHATLFVSGCSFYSTLRASLFFEIYFVLLRILFIRRCSPRRSANYAASSPCYCPTK